MGRRKDSGLTREDVARIMGSQSVQTGGLTPKGSFPARIQAAQARNEAKKGGK
jgi:hypothetical protein